MGVFYHSEGEEQAGQTYHAADAAGLRAEERLAAKENGVAVEHWVATLEKEIRAYRSWKRRQQIRWVIRTGVICALVIAVLTRHIHGFPFWLFWVIGGGAAADAAAGKREQAASALAETDDPRAVGVLAIASRDGDDVTRAVAERGLKNILPKLRASDAQYIYPEGMTALIALLNSYTGLTAVILKSFEQIGDARAIPAVERLIQETTGYDPLRELHEAAQECLTFLKLRAEQEHLRSTLLRAAQNPVDPAESLLRPASSGSDTPPEQLLRPAETTD